MKNIAYIALIFTWYFVLITLYSNNSINLLQVVILTIAGFALDVAIKVHLLTKKSKPLNSNEKTN